jgi:hypothetical protein
MVVVVGTTNRKGNATMNLLKVRVVGKNEDCKQGLRVYVHRVNHVSPANI